MNIAIVEDLEKDCEWLAGRLEQYLTSRHLTYQLYTYKQAEDFVAALDTITFQIVFMDIYLTDMTGIEAASILRQKDRDCKLIILTVSDEFLLQGYQVHASHYLIKPATDRDFLEAMERCMLKPAHEVPVLDIVLDGLPLPLNTETILYLQSHKRDVLIQTTAQPLLIGGPFHAFADILSADSRFLLILRGILINMDHVASIDDTMIIMKNGDKLPYNVRNRRQIQHTYRNYIFCKMGGNS
ncbi:MAG: response regulator transcription factor [Lachnospiraceae bacterium]|nr:response regulator transcription factor [Lachnospiraceae bacterium]